MDWLIDSTLRDGEQSPGVVFSYIDKLQIAALLDQAGIKELEIGTPAMGVQEREEIHELLQHDFSFKATGWCRAKEEDLKAAIDCGLKRVNISFPVSDILLKTMSRSRQWVLNNLFELVSMANEQFDFVAIGAQDASRADLGFLYKFISACEELEADRIRIADTVGILSPMKCFHLFQQLTNSWRLIPFEFHGHNDLGMATANSLMALEGGARFISGTINGLGERAGNAALEEVAAAYQFGLGKPLEMNFDSLQQVSALVAELSGRDIPPDKPIVGRQILMHESGIHAGSVIVNAKSYQPFHATEIGKNKEEIVFGKHSGGKALMAFLKFNKLLYNERIVKKLLERIKTYSLVSHQNAEYSLILNWYKELKSIDEGVQF